MKRILVLAAIASITTAANAQNNNSASTTTTTATTAPATGTTTTTAPAPEAAAKAWSVTLLNEASAGAAELHYANRTSKSYSLLNYVGAGYKLNPKHRIGIRQYFKADRDGDKAQFTNTMMDSVLTYSGEFGKIGASDTITPSVWYYVPTSDASRKVQSNGTLRSDIEVAYTLNPKVTVSYLFNPRQSFVPAGSTLNKKGEAVDHFSRTTLIQMGYAYYNISDSIVAYANAGYLHSWKTANLALSDEAFMAGIGASFSFFSGKLSLNPEISTSSDKVSSFKKVAAGKDIQESTLTYALTSAISF